MLIVSPKRGELSDGLTATVVEDVCEKTIRIG